MKASLWDAFGKTFSVEVTLMVKGAVSEMDCLLNNPGSTADQLCHQESLATFLLPFFIC